MEHNSPPKRKPLTTSDLLFPTTSSLTHPTLSQTLSALRRSTLTIPNRLRSILSDSSFVLRVSTAYSLPLIANERCGSWYIPPAQKAGSAYFKSTDGHTGEWRFNLRRLNAQVLEVVARERGCVIVDSTRRGKMMPDALSKTVPIWCCVMNRVMWPGDEERGRLFTPPNAVGQSEHAQIEERIEGFVKDFLAMKPDVEEMRRKLGKPLRPLWVTRTSTLPEESPVFEDFYPVVLCTSSIRVQGAEMSENGYIQGAGDDHEAWACGLTPAVFWANKDILLETPEGELPDLIKYLVSNAADKTMEAKPSTLIVPSSICIGSGMPLEDDLPGLLNAFDAVVMCRDPKGATESPQAEHVLQLDCSKGKFGSKDLRVQLPKVSDFIQKHFTTNQRDRGNGDESISDLHSFKLLILGESDSDLPIGVALSILCQHVDEKGIWLQIPNERINKDFIRQRLHWIMQAMPDARPSRATLQSVNAFLMS